MSRSLLPILVLVALSACSGSVPDDPGQVERFEKAWAEYHRYVGDRYPQIDFKLRSGADETRISAFEAATGRVLPSELRALYELANGQDAGGFALFPGHRMLSLEEITTQLGLMNGSKLFFFRFLPADGDPGVKNWWWHKKWLPIGENGAGDLFCVDFAPTTEGVQGQLIEFIHDDSLRHRYATSLAKLFEELRSGLENGEWVPYLEWQVLLSREEATEYGFVNGEDGEPGSGTSPK